MYPALPFSVFQVTVLPKGQPPSPEEYLYSFLVFTFELHTQLFVTSLILLPEQY